MKDLGRIFKALADPTRRKILELLRVGEHTAGAIAARVRRTRPAISHHLAILKGAGLAVERRDGQHIIYALRTTAIDRAWDGFLARLCAKSPPRRATKKSDK